MRKLFAYPKIRCARCEHENRQDFDYCSQCGLMLGSPDHDAVLRQQRWLPADNEVAIFFAVQAIDKIAKSPLQIPARARAFLLQDQRQIELTAGNYDSASLRAKTTQLNADQPVDILITRSLPFALHFSFDDLHSAEFLAIHAKCLVRIKIDHISHFAQHFMHGPGSISTSELQDLFHATVKLSLQRWLSSYSLRDIQDQAELAEERDTHLLGELNGHLAKYGLAATQAIVQELSHQKLSTDREKFSEQIAFDEMHLDAQHKQIEQGKTANTLYSEREWQRVAKQEEQVRLRYRHEEMRQQFSKDLGWLYMQGEHDHAKRRLSRAKLQQDEAERLQTIRSREIDTYRQIAEAHTRKQAINQETADTIRELEHTLKEKSESRQNEADQWLHVRTLARIKMRSESELSQLHCKQAAQILQQDIEQQIQRLQLEHQIAQSRLIADQEQQAQQTQQLRKKEAQLAQREQELEDEQQKNRLIQISLETEVRAREFQRMQAWEETLHQQRTRDLQREERVKETDTELKVAQVQINIDSLQRESELARSATQQEKLLRTLEVHQRVEQQEQQKALLAVEVEKQRRQVGQEEEHQRWQRDLQSTLADQQQQVAMAKLEIERLNAIANFSETGKIATAEVANANALAEVMKLQTQATMSAEQILAAQAGQSMHAAQAMSAMAQIQQGMSLEQAMKMLQERLREEREQRELELQRRHQIDLNMVQNFGQQRAYPQANGRK